MGATNSVTRKDFQEALRGLAACGELNVLTDAFSKAVSADSRELIEKAIISAMKVSQRDDWMSLMYHTEPTLVWTGREAVGRVLGIRCSEPTKAMARRLLEKDARDSRGYRLHLSEAMRREKEKNLSRLDDHLLTLNSYLVIEYIRESRKDVLSSGTVRPPGRRVHSDLDLDRYADTYSGEPARREFRGPKPRKR